MKKKRIFIFCLHSVLTWIAYIVLTKTVFAPDEIDISIMLSAGIGAGIAAVVTDAWLPRLIQKIVKPLQKK